ncbi:unnamed protein product [Eruca vesicaria subsp. sativa]|uniref:Uncharacterized protein n=1 Tax=Eruca vesicaria subsp. sativa TaxID=29727 RepID=A0ABC8M5R8_ERUVS|nr:unnamed protein product [Eruca vesicaria subsp. sativa]
MPIDSRTVEEEDRNPCANGGDSDVNVKGAKHNKKRKEKMEHCKTDGDDYGVDEYNEKKKGKMIEYNIDGDVDVDVADTIFSEEENRENFEQVCFMFLVIRI